MSEEQHLNVQRASTLITYKDSDSDNNDDSSERKITELGIISKSVQIPCENEEDSDSEHSKDNAAGRMMTMTNTKLIGQYITLKNVENDEEITYKIESIASSTDTEKNKFPDLMQESTNQWLYNDRECNYNLLIALFVILVQILSYIAMTYFLITSYDKNIQDREENCWGPNKKEEEQKCMNISTGLVTMVLLLGFLLADFIEFWQMFKKGTLCMICGSLIILIELLAALICGVLVGVYTDGDFDAINGAVGILFVHDLDEKIYSAMKVIQSNFKKIKNIKIGMLLVSLVWIGLVMAIAIPLRCVYDTDGCKGGEFQCGDECIWKGFVCNGVEDCKNGLDEDQNCDFSLIDCPVDQFRCNSTGSCIDFGKQCDGYIDCKDGSDELFVAERNSDDKFECESSGICIDIDKRCNGILDCDDASDEGHDQNCAALIEGIICGDIQAIFEQKYDHDDLYLTPSNGSMFKCNNGQCIDAKYLCDGNLDCIDASDEYPNFFKPNEFPYLKTCPYEQLVECEIDQVLCKQNGKCISKMRVCDGNIDCLDGQDEQGCPSTCKDYFNEFQCGSTVAKINQTNIIMVANELIYDIVYLDIFGDWFILSNYTNIYSEPFVIVNDSVNISLLSSYGGRHFYEYEFYGWIQRAEEFLSSQYTKNPTTECISSRNRCDGIADCSDLSDEQLCHLFECADNEYQCPQDSPYFGKCIPNDWVCDGVCDCGYPQNNDDLLRWCADETCYSSSHYVGCNKGSIRVSITKYGSQAPRFILVVGKDERDFGYSKVIFSTCYQNVTNFRTEMNVRSIIQVNSTIHEIINNKHANPITCNDHNGFGNIIEIDMNEHWAIVARSTRSDPWDDYVPNNYITVEIQSVYVKETVGTFELVTLCST